MTSISSNKNLLLFNIKNSNQLLRLSYNHRVTNLLDSETLSKQKSIAYKVYLSGFVLQNLALHKKFNGNFHQKKTPNSILGTEYYKSISYSKKERLELNAICSTKLNALVPQSILLLPRIFIDPHFSKAFALKFYKNKTSKIASWLKRPTLFKEKNIRSLHKSSYVPLWKLCLPLSFCFCSQKTLSLRKLCFPLSFTGGVTKLRFVCSESNGGVTKLRFVCSESNGDSRSESNKGDGLSSICTSTCFGSPCKQRKNLKEEVTALASKEKHKASVKLGFKKGGGLNQSEQNKVQRSLDSIVTLLISYNFNNLKEKAYTIKQFAPALKIWSFAFGSSFFLIGITSILQRQEQNRWFLSFSRSVFPGLYLTSEESSWECFENITLKYLSRKCLPNRTPNAKNLVKKIDCYKDILYMGLAESWNQQAIQNYTAIFSKSSNSILSEGSLEEEKQVEKKNESVTKFNLVNDSSSHFLSPEVHVAKATEVNVTKASNGGDRKQRGISNLFFFYKKPNLKADWIVQPWYQINARYPPKKEITKNVKAYNQDEFSTHPLETTFSLNRKAFSKPKRNRYKEQVSIENDSIPSKMSSSATSNSKRRILGSKKLGLSVFAEDFTSVAGSKASSLMNRNNFLRESKVDKASQTKQRERFAHGRNHYHRADGLSRNEVKLYNCMDKAKNYIDSPNDLIKNLFYESDNFCVEPKAFSLTSKDTDFLPEQSLSFKEIVQPSVKSTQGSKEPDFSESGTSSLAKSNNSLFLRSKNPSESHFNAAKANASLQKEAFEKVIYRDRFSFLQKESFFGLPSSSFRDRSSLKVAPFFCKKSFNSLQVQTTDNSLIYEKNPQIDIDLEQKDHLSKSRSFWHSSHLGVKTQTNSYRHLKKSRLKRGEKISSYLLFKRKTVSNRFMSGYQRPEATRLRIKKGKKKMICRGNSGIEFSIKVSPALPFYESGIKFLRNPFNQAFTEPITFLQKKVLDETKFLPEVKPTFGLSFSPRARRAHQVSLLQNPAKASKIQPLSGQSFVIPEEQSKGIHVTRNQRVKREKKEKFVSRIKSIIKFKKMPYKELSLYEKGEIEPLFEQVNKTFNLSPYRFTFKKSLFADYNDYLSWPKDNPVAISISPFIEASVDEEKRAVKDYWLASSPETKEKTGFAGSEANKASLSNRNAPYNGSQTSKGLVRHPSDEIKRLQSENKSSIGKSSSPSAKGSSTELLQKPGSSSPLERPLRPRLSEPSYDRNTNTKKTNSKSLDDSLLPLKEQELRAFKNQSKKEEKERWTGFDEDVEQYESQKRNASESPAGLSARDTEEMFPIESSNVGEEEEKKKEITKSEWLEQIRESEQHLEKRKDLQKLAYPHKKALANRSLQKSPGKIHSLLVSDRKASFFGITNLFPKRLISEDQKQIAVKILREAINQKSVSLLENLNKKYDGTNSLEKSLSFPEEVGLFDTKKKKAFMGSDKVEMTQNKIGEPINFDAPTENKLQKGGKAQENQSALKTSQVPGQIKDLLVPNKANASAYKSKICIYKLCTPFGDHKASLCNKSTGEGHARNTLGVTKQRFVIPKEQRHFPEDNGVSMKLCTCKPLYFKKRTTKLITRQHPIYTPNRRLRLRVPQPSLVAQNSSHQARLDDLNLSSEHRWWQKRRISSSLLGAPSKRYLVMPEISTQDWRKIIEWQLKIYFLEEEKRLFKMQTEEKVSSEKKAIQRETFSGNAEKSFVTEAPDTKQLFTIKKLAIYLPWTSLKKSLKKPFEWPVTLLSYSSSLHPQKSGLFSGSNSFFFQGEKKKDGTPKVWFSSEKTFPPDKLNPPLCKVLGRKFEKERTIENPRKEGAKLSQKDFDSLTDFALIFKFCAAKARPNNTTNCTRTKLHFVRRSIKSLFCKGTYGTYVRGKNPTQNFIRNKKTDSCFVSSITPPFKSAPIFAYKSSRSNPLSICKNSQRLFLTKNVSASEKSNVYQTKENDGSASSRFALNQGSKKPNRRFVSKASHSPKMIVTDMLQSSALYGTKVNQNNISKPFLFEAQTKSSYLLLHGLFLVIGLKGFLGGLGKIFGTFILSKVKNSSLSVLLFNLFFNTFRSSNSLYSFDYLKTRAKHLADSEDTISSLSEIVWYLRNSCRGRLVPRGVVLVEKFSSESTNFLKAIGGEAQVPVIVQSLRALPYTQNHPQRQLEKILTFAQKRAPCILFLDDLDSIGQSRTLLLKNNEQLCKSEISINTFKSLRQKTQQYEKHWVRNLPSLSKGFTRNLPQSKLLKGAILCNEDSQSRVLFDRKKTDFGKKASGSNKSSICHCTCSRKLDATQRRRNSRFDPPNGARARKKICTSSCSSLACKNRPQRGSICTCKVSGEKRKCTRYKNNLDKPLTAVTKTIVTNNLASANSCKAGYTHNRFLDKLKRTNGSSYSRFNIEDLYAKVSTDSEKASYKSKICRPKNDEPLNFFSELEKTKTKITPFDVHPETEKVVEQRRVDLMLRLLTVMDGISGLNGVLIVTTSKDPSLLDPALLRPGRFEKLIHLKLPTKKKRILLLKRESARLGHTNPMPWDFFGRQTQNMAGSDIVSAVNHSAFRAIMKSTVHSFPTLEYGINRVTKSCVPLQLGDLMPYVPYKDSQTRLTNRRFVCLVRNTKGVTKLANTNLRFVNACISFEAQRSFALVSLVRKFSNSSRNRRRRPKLKGLQSSALFALLSQKENKDEQTVSEEISSQISFYSAGKEIVRALTLGSSFYIDRSQKKYLIRTDFAKETIHLYAGQAALALYLNSISSFKNKWFTHTFLCTQKRPLALQSTFSYKEGFRASFIIKNMTDHFCPKTKEKLFKTIAKPRFTSMITNRKIVCADQSNKNSLEGGAFLSYYNMVLSCFYVAFQNCTENRELLDFVTDHLIRFKTLKLQEILRIALFYY